MSTRPKWLDDRAWYRVVNLEQQGTDIYVSLNGHNFLIKHGEVVKIPKAVADLINSSQVTKWKIEGKMNGSRTKTSYLEPRYMATKTDPPESEEKSSSKAKIAKALADAKKNEVEEGVE